jgi:uncharacterized protein YjgD (DUF1641 family)
MAMNETPQLRSSPVAIGSDRNALVLERIDQRLARVEAALARAEALERAVPAAIATATDTFDDLVDRLGAKGIDIDERLHDLLDALERLTSPEALRALSTLFDKLELVQHLLDSGILAEPSVDVVGKAGNALAAARAEAPPELGLWGAARAMSDEDVKRAVGFLMRFAQLFGRSLDRHDVRSTPRLTEGTAP